MTLPARYTVRFAVPEDAGVIQAQREAMFADMGEDARKLADVHTVSLAWHRRALQTGVYHGLLVEHEGRVVAGAGLLWQDLPPNPETGRDRRAYVMNVYVQPEHRGQRLSRLLMERILDECGRLDVNLVSLHASDAGRRTYERLGFRTTNEMKRNLSEEKS